MDLPDHGVLVVDDDPGIRLLLATVLRRRGFQVLEARNGREALAVMRAGNADLVITDLRMPEVSGWDVLRERAASPALLQIPMIVMTANNSRELRAAMVDQHVYAVVGKPFDLGALMTIVTASLDLAHVPAPIAA